MHATERNGGTSTDNMTYLIITLGLAGILYVSVKSLRAIRRVGFLRFIKALGGLVAASVGAFGKLVGGRESGPATRSPKGSAVFPIEDGDDHWDKTWDKVGAVSAPEQYLHHPDAEVSALAHSQLDDD